MAQAARLNLRMQKELKLLMTDPLPGVSLQLADNENFSSSLSSIEALVLLFNVLQGFRDLTETVYSGGTFTVKIQVPERYPFQPPNVTFVTPIYHPNIDNGGRVCLDILNLPPKGAWQPSLNISTVLTSIGLLLLCEPNPDDGLMAEISREYKYNRQVFDQKARSWTEKYANPGSSAANDLNNLDAPCAVLQPLTEVEKSEAVSGNSFNVSEGSRKKLRLMAKSCHLNQNSRKEEQ
uniref:E2 ubiquitin-conjugating enzyme n=1 Tax=Ananas comosus var. bracteatus TaxID=296719 RepID=A0A6V7NZF7_ANACO|nr:unnamed protein product [Ananas comosus var. bracteatus]